MQSDWLFESFGNLGGTGIMTGLIRMKWQGKFASCEAPIHSSVSNDDGTQCLMIILMIFRNR